MIGRQLAQMLCALVLARILGPSTYGVISAATVYVTLTTLLLDQGLAAALVQRPMISERLPGAVATANLATGLVLAVATWLAAPAIADFFHTPALTLLLRVLGLGLMLKALAVTPRAMQQRGLRFRMIAIADIAGGGIGAAAGISAALLGEGSWSMAWQVLVTDCLIAGWLLVKTRGAAPNFRIAEVRSVLPFSLRIFASNGLAFLSRNADNILVGRFLGVFALSNYSMAYRVLVIPVQMIGQTVNRVAFPTFSRLAEDTARLGVSLLRISALLSFAAVLPMTLAAVASRQLIEIVLGPAWATTAPVLTILAIAGARETVFIITASLMRAKGRGKLMLRYEWLATGLQLTGIGVGLSFGLIGVALGYTLAGFLLTPVLLLIQRRLVGIHIKQQLSAILPPVHAAAWGACGYLAVSFVGWGQVATVVAGTAAYCLLGFAVLWLAHRQALLHTVAEGLLILGRRSKTAGAA